jgi:hypothetical protein
MISGLAANQRGSLGLLDIGLVKFPGETRVGDFLIFSVWDFSDLMELTFKERKTFIQT